MLKTITVLGILKANEVLGAPEVAVAKVVEISK